MDSILPEELNFFNWWLYIGYWLTNDLDFLSDPSNIANETEFNDFIRNSFYNQVAAFLGFLVGVYLMLVGPPTIFITLIFVTIYVLGYILGYFHTEVLDENFISEKFWSFVWGVLVGMFAFSVLALALSLVNLR
ncbi:MAG TPA: hypothetical protein VLI92_00040 [Candidatus Saccharimonadales bacterium]|nr:hypothetical protein [Candidatus Saccharimonadales bacterium]